MVKTQKKVSSLSFDFIGGTDVMPIIGYFGPHQPVNDRDDTIFPNQYTDEYFQLIADTGINIIGPSETDYETHPELVKKTLELGEKHGLGIIVTDGRLVKESGSDLSFEEMERGIGEYENYPAYCGNYVKDEPCYEEDGKRAIRNYEKMFRFLNERETFAWGNLLGMYLTPEEKYRKYVDEWMRVCHPPMLSYDIYKFGAYDIGHTDRPEIYFNGLSIIREAAEKAGVPFWPFVQAGSQWNDGRKSFDSCQYFPSKGEFLWNVGSYLAFGAKGIQYFPLIQPDFFAWAKSKPFDFERNGFIGADGRKTRWYAYAQEINAQIRAVDKVLMNAVNFGVLAPSPSAREHMSGTKYLLEGTAWRELTKATGEAMIGCFDYQGKTAFYVVNHDVRETREIRMEFDDICQTQITMDAKTHSETGRMLRLTITAGNSALVVIDKGGQV